MKTRDRIMWQACAVFTLIGSSLQQNASLRLEVEPRYVQARLGTPVTLTCTLRDDDGGSVPIAGCGFRDYKSGSAWDIGTGSATINHTINERQTMGIITNQEGDGLCTLKVTGLEWGLHTVGCRVRPSVSGAWRYAAMMVHVTTYPPLQYSLQPTGVVVALPGSNVSIVGEAGAPIDECRFFLPPNNTKINLESPYKSYDTTQYRHWREGNRCGVTLLGVKPEDSGFLRGRVWSIYPVGAFDDFIELLVATPPVSPPLLSVNTTNTTFQAGDMLHATCVVDESRPVPNITWLLGGEVVREDNWNEALEESTWRWNHEPQKTIQRLSRRLKQQDDGKELKCRAGHLALSSEWLDSNTHFIRVGEFAPDITVPPSNVTTVDGGNVTLTCRVFGAPKPLVKWVRGGIELTGGRYTIFDNGDLEIRAVDFLDAGRYTCYAENKFGKSGASGSLAVKDNSDESDATEVALPPASSTEAAQTTSSDAENASALTSTLKPSSIICDDHALRLKISKEMKYRDEIHSLKLKEAEILVEVAVQRKREATAAADIAELQLTRERQKH